MRYLLAPALKVILVCAFLAILSNTAECRPQRNRALLYTSVPIDEAPYNIQLRDGNGDFFCAGTLVSPAYVVTAAECFDNVDYTKSVVVAKAYTPAQQGVQRKIVKLTKHPEYESTNKFSNVAVLKLKEPLDLSFSDGTKPVERYPVNSPIKENDYVRVLGWRHMLNNTSVSNELYTVRLQIIPQGNCEKDFNTTPEHKQFCLVGNGYDNHYCVADLGSPALYRGALAGIATSCHSCEDVEHTISYTNVYEVKSFIESAMN